MLNSAKKEYSNIKIDKIAQIITQEQPCYKNIEMK